MKKGFKHTQETRDKISASHKKNHKMWREYRAALLRECARESFVETQVLKAMAAAAEGAGHPSYTGPNGDGHE